MLHAQTASDSRTSTFNIILLNCFPGKSFHLQITLSPQQAAQGFFSAPFACGSLNPISSGVFFTNTTSFPRAKKLL